MAPVKPSAKKTAESAKETTSMVVEPVEPNVQGTVRIAPTDAFTNVLNVRATLARAEEAYYRTGQSEYHTAKPADMLRVAKIMREDNMPFTRIGGPSANGFSPAVAIRTEYIIVTSCGECTEQYL